MERDVCTLTFLYFWERFFHLWCQLCTQRRWLGVARHADGCQLQLGLRATGYWLVRPVTRVCSGRKVLEVRTLTDEERIQQLENELEVTILFGEEADRKYEEVCRSNDKSLTGIHCKNIHTSHG